MTKIGVEARPIGNGPELELRGGVAFDPDLLVLEGSYTDELSAYRARKVWTQVLETNFLLEWDYDFMLNVSKGMDPSSYLLRCSFVSACGRYAFWRLTHGQASDAQYVIETAHIPNSTNHYYSILAAPDLRAMPGVDTAPISDYHRLTLWDRVRFEWAVGCARIRKFVRKSLHNH
jgi:hypothetical protein